MSRIKEEEKKIWDKTRINRIGANILIQEPHPNLIAFRTEIQHPAHARLRDMLVVAKTFTGILENVAIYCGYQLYGAATNEQVFAILGTLTTKLIEKRNRRTIIIP